MTFVLSPLRSFRASASVFFDNGSRTDVWEPTPRNYHAFLPKCLEGLLKGDLQEMCTFFQEVRLRL